jgi:hypothetical protein
VDVITELYKFHYKRIRRFEARLFQFLVECTPFPNRFKVVFSRPISLFMVGIANFALLLFKEH